jgi:flagellar biosynthesis/type III secretory pathway M-ring protein FliF/YscJ
LALPEVAEGTRDRVLELAAADPERTADIIRAWLRADQPT